MFLIKIQLCIPYKLIICFSTRTNIVYHIVRQMSRNNIEFLGEMWNLNIPMGDDEYNEYMSVRKAKIGILLDG